MRRSNLRFLGLGFLLSALLLTGFQLLGNREHEAENGKVESLIAEKEEYRAKYEEVLAQYEALQQQVKPTATEGDSRETSPSGPVTFSVEEGQPTAVVLENLVKEGLLANVQEAEKYLTDNGLLTQIRFGTYELSKDMEMEEVFAVLTGTE